MKRRNIKKLIFVGALITLIAVGWQITLLVTSAEPLSEVEASERVQEMYSADIVAIKTLDNIYQISIHLNTGTYDVNIDRKTGEISSLTRTATQDESINNKELTEAEIKEDILDQQIGEIKKIEKKQEGEQTFYYVVVKQGVNQIRLKLHAFTGEIVELTPETPSKAKEQATRLTKEEAIKIALENVNGKVDDVDLEHSGGLTYYLVEIEQANDQEATVQINAISGKVMTITWDD